MKNKIKELRLRIDGLSQLVKDLSGSNTYLVDLDLIPEKYDSEKLMKIFNDAKNGILQSVDSSTTQVVYLSSELDKAYDSLILAKAWLGKVLGELGEESPYINDGKRKDIKDIEPTADKVDFNSNKIEFTFGTALTHGKSYYNFTHIEKVDWLREEINNLIGFVQSDFNRSLPNHSSQKLSREFSIARTNSYNQLSEARFWLGFELQRIASSNNKIK